MEREMFLIAIDQSTSGTKAILFNKNGKIVQRVNAAHTQIYPHPGWVEHDPEEIMNNINKTIDDLVNITGIEYVIRLLKPVWKMK